MKFSPCSVDVLDCCLIGCHIFGSVICRSVVCLGISVLCCPACYVSDVDCGLGEISQTFCADGLVGLVIGSCGSGPTCAGDLVWFLIGFPVLGLGS